MNHARTFLRLSQLAGKSGVKVAFKDESKLMKCIAKLLFFRPDFLTETVTTWGDTLYYPSRQWLAQNPEQGWRELAHGLIHISDIRRVSLPLYVLSYLFPQSLSLLALGFAYNPCFLLSLVFLLPWPAPFRKHWEMRATAMSMATEVWGGKEPSVTVAVSRFSGRHYYWCWPFPSSLRSELAQWLGRVHAKKLGLLLPHTSDVKFSIRIEGVLR